MNITISLRAPVDNGIDLSTLPQEIETRGSSATTHPFDGETVIELLILITPMSYPFFRTWITNCAKARKEFSIVHDGTELKGYTADEATRILEVLRTEVDSGNGK